MISYLERLQHELDAAVAGSSRGAMARAPEGKWNGLQIMEHLFLTYRHTNKALEKCVEQGTPLATKATAKHRIATMLVVGVGYIPSGRNSPERAVPRGMAEEEVGPALASELKAMGAALDRCEQKFGARTKLLDHPFLGPLSASQWRKFHWVHGRHHIRQIRERLGNPDSRS